MLFQDALKEQELQVTELIKTGGKYLAALKSWKKSCETGHVVNLQKAAASAQTLSKALDRPTHEAADAWEFDTQEYLETSAWRDELESVCSEKYNLRIIVEDDYIVSPPLIVRAQSHLSRLQLGKKPWPTIHPVIIAKELKRLNEISVNEKECQQFLNILYEVCKKDSSENSDLRTKFREIYNRFAMTPGYTKDNTPASFGQQINALDESGVRTTKDGKVFYLEGPAGKPKAQDIFDVISKNGSLKQYFIVWFK